MAQSLLVALDELNTTEMSAMLSVLPKNFQVRITLMLIHVVVKFSREMQVSE